MIGVSMENISKYILKGALAAGICEEWAVFIANTDTVDEFLKMYVKGIDFCLEKNFPANDDLVNLGGDRLEQYGIYVDRVVDYPAGDFLVFLGRSEGPVIANGFSVSQIFIKHECDISLKVADNAFVVIDCFDNSKLDVTASGNSKVMINVYGQAQVSDLKYNDAIIKIVHKNKPTY